MEEHVDLGRLPPHDELVRRLLCVTPKGVTTLLIRVWQARQFTQSPPDAMYSARVLSIYMGESNSWQARKKRSRFSFVRTQEAHDFIYVSYKTGGKICEKRFIQGFRLCDLHLQGLRFDEQRRTLEAIRVACIILDTKHRDQMFLDLATDRLRIDPLKGEMT